jgi:PhnB protein
MLMCRDPEAEIAFCAAAFGAEELSRRSGDDGQILHATLHIGGLMLMVHGETPWMTSRPPALDGSSPVVIYLYLPEVDVLMERAVAAGARVLFPVEDQFWGDRKGSIVDPEGHLWNIASRVKG